MGARSPRIPVEPTVLRWARETAGYELDEAAHKAGLSATETLAEYESGQKQPSLAQLRKLADVYKRALAVLLSSSVPAEPPLPPDFRLVQGMDRPQSPAVMLTIRKLRAYQAEAAELIEDEGEASTITLPRAQADAEAAAATIRAWLAVEPGDVARARGEKALRYWRDLAEEKGLLAMGFAGVPVAQLRGLSLPHPQTPLVAYNMADTAGARVFSLLHEVAHLARREAGLCLGQDDVQAEAWCNAVAGNALVPRHELAAEPERLVAASGDDDALARIAYRFGVSREVVLRRLVEIGLASKATYAAARARWQSRYGDTFESEPDRGDGGPSYYRTQVARLGRRYVRLVVEAMNDSRVTTNAACQLLGCKVSGLASMQKEARL